MTALPHHLSGIHLACEREQDISADDMAAYTGMPLSAVQGLLGPGTVATVTVDVDCDPLRPWHWDSAPDEGAIIPLTRGHWSAESVICEHAPEWLQRALDHWDIDERTGRDDEGLRYLARYARSQGYTVTVETLADMSPSDWMDVVSIHRAGESSCVDDWRIYWDEGGFLVTVKVLDVRYPTTVCTVGYAGIEQLVAELLQEGFDARLLEVRTAS